MQNYEEEENKYDIDEEATRINALVCNFSINSTITKLNIFKLIIIIEI